MRRLALALILVLAAATALAQQHDMKKMDMAPEMKPDPMLRQLDFLAGNWTCKGMTFANPMAPEHATQGTIAAGWKLGEYWMAFSYTEMSSDKNPMPYATSGFMGYDMGQKKLSMGGVDNMGGYATSFSEGWKGDTLTFEGPAHMGPMTVTSRDTFTKKSAGEIVHAAWMQMDGKWMQIDEETCTKDM